MERWITKRSEKEMKKVKCILCGKSADKPVLAYLCDECALNECEYTDKDIKKMVTLESS